MRLSTLLAVTALTSTATPVGPSGDTRSIEHEQRSAKTPWAKATRFPRSHLLPLRIGLTQRNLDRAEEFLVAVSDPGSPSYGKHWTREEVIETFAPDKKAVEEVLGWLEDEGIDRSRTKVSRGRGWVEAEVTGGDVERLLGTEYHVYKRDGRSQVACERYLVPERVSRYVDIILPSVHFDQPLGDPHGIRSPLENEKASAQKRALAKEPHPEAVARSGAGTLDSLPLKGRAAPNILSQLTSCDTAITPACLRALYAMPPGTLHSPNNSLGVVQYTPQAYLQTDLDLFFSEFQPALVGRGPEVHLLAGGVVQREKQSFFYNGESSLDLGYAMALVYPQRVTLYQVGDMERGASFNNFLDAVDGSYCAFQGGGSKDPNVDGQYSHESSCGTAPLTNVISTSYAYNEGDLGVRYQQRQCAEYMKLGLQGVSVIFPSGDFGVAGNANACFDPLTGAYQHGSMGGIFNPSFPSTCPWVTSVGATEVMRGSSVRSEEVTCETVVRSGGGFSNVFGVPGYQEEVMEWYLGGLGGRYKGYEGRYNDSGAARGYPDVSANGASYVTAVNGKFTLSYGTSCTSPLPSLLGSLETSRPRRQVLTDIASTPVFASMLTLINEKRLQAGKSPVGFVNPVLYANPGVLNDIRHGRKPGCATEGFEAREGWDPVTGLG